MRTTLAFAVLAAIASTSPARAQCTPVEVGALAPPAGSSSGWADNLGISGDTAVMGDSGVDGQAPLSGLALVYERDLGGPDAWGLAMKIAPQDGASFDAFGSAADAWGDTLAVGASLADGTIPDTGAVYLFERDLGGPGNWGESTKLVSSEPAPSSGYGYLVRLEGDTLFVAASGADGAAAQTGAVYVYERDLGGPGNWGERTKLFASDGVGGDLFGRTIASSGDTLVVGATRAAGAAADSGAAYVYERDLGGPDSWGEAAKLSASNGHTGAWFGSSVGNDGNTVVVGSFFNNQFGPLSGAAYVFERDQGGPGAWGEVTGLIGSDHTFGYMFGASAGVAGDTVIVGATVGSHPGPGKYYLFHRDEGGAGEWGQVAIIQGPPETSLDGYGSRLEVDGLTLAVGLMDGEMQVYEGPTSTTPAGYCTAGVSASGCAAAISVSGTPSATAATGFFLRAASVEGAKDGLFFFGTSGRQANSWGNGTSYQCVVPPVRRGGLLTGQGTAGKCDGAFSQDLSAHWTAKPTHSPGAGALVQAQLWYRDPQNTSNQTTSLSDAVEFTVCP